MDEEFNGFWPFTRGFGKGVIKTVESQFTSVRLSAGVNYFCRPCKTDIRGINGQEGLKLHFENVHHNPTVYCRSCSQPGYAYECKKEKKIYYKCTCNNDA